METDDILDGVLDTVFSKFIKMLLISLRLRFWDTMSRLGRLGVCIVIPDVLIKHPPKCTLLKYIDQ